MYDPWLDYDDDGKISMTDIVMTVSVFGTKGPADADVYVSIGLFTTT